MRLYAVKQWISDRVELTTLIAALLVAASIWGFVSVAGEVVEGDTKGFDAEILLSLRNPADASDPLGPRWAEEFGRDMTAFGGTGALVLITLFAAGFLWMQGKRRSMLLVLAAIGSGFLMSQLLKYGFDRPRPSLVPHGSFVYTASFPSGHAMMSAVTYLTLAILVARVQTQRRVRAFLIGVAVFLTVLVGVSRVYLGVHWPSDVLAGWTAGAAWAVGWWMIARWLESRGAVEPEATAADDFDGNRPAPRSPTI
ncbi:phosphatase PAP2 family protein [Aurantimonas sp. E1-2-R+4]|uniref:phosphatase PAP2 family protein n=1 Tax=Aurantimonas sp. E1-2-R+4 TaxID=3113714 RepID=UPI002F943A4E